MVNTREESGSSKDASCKTLCQSIPSVLRYWLGKEKLKLHFWLRVKQCSTERNASILNKTKYRKEELYISSS